MPLQETSGAASYDAFGGGVAAVPNYIEDVFSTWLYTGNGSTQTITNGIDLSGKGGLVWIKDRSQIYNHTFWDTARGALNSLASNNTDQSYLEVFGVTAFNANGFSMNASSDTNFSGDNFVSWTFRKQPKFFDVVTYTGTGSNTTIAHNLGSVPGCILVKRTDTTGAWQVYHRSLANTEYLVLNTTAAKATNANRWNSTTPTSTVFSLGTDASVNASGGTYVAYLFAHDAGGFGLTGTDNVISCGSCVGGATVSLGWEPQWVLIKSSTSIEDWTLVDVMRGDSALGFNPSLGAGNWNSANVLYANKSGSEQSNFNRVAPFATGFTANGLDSGQTYIYIAIRRGPMKTPTSGTSVFSPFTTAGATGTAVTTNFPVDFQLYKYRAGIDYFFDVDRLRGVNSTTTGNSTPWLDTTATTAEVSATNVSRNWGNTGFEVPGIVGGASNVFYSFRRAPGFFDEVCYTGTGSNTTQTHNLGAVPELMIVKGRSDATAWQVYSSALANTEYLVLNTTAAKATGATRWNSTTPTSTVFSLGTATEVNTSAATYVAYLFATVSGVSKVGSYTGTGALQTVNCGFTSGARFVLIKRTDSTGDWYVYDSARGITSSDDPYLLMNSTAAEVTNTNYVDTDTTGFKVTAAAPAGLNANGGTFLFLAVA